MRGLVHERYLPTCEHVSPVTRKNLAAHLGDGTGEAARAGGKNARAAEYALLHVLGARQNGWIDVNPVSAVADPPNVRPRMTTGPSPGKSGP